MGLDFSNIFGRSRERTSRGTLAVSAGAVVVKENPAMKAENRRDAAIARRLLNTQRKIPWEEAKAEIRASH